MSEEVAAADSLLTENAELRRRILEWEDAYDRLHGAFDLHMDILECKQALSDYAGVFYDVVIGEQADRADQFEQALAVAMKENEQRIALEWRLIAELATLRQALIHGLGLANELGEGERWADWRLRVHTLLNQEHPGAVLIGIDTTKEAQVNITQITVSYGETQSLPEYSNVKPNITITAALDEGDDPTAVELNLWAHAKQQVHEQIDLALEGNNIPAKYSTEPRFQVLKTRTSSFYDRGKPELPKLVAIIPNESKLDDRFVHAGWRESRKLRYGHAQRLAAETSDDGYTLLDCADGDISRLEALLPPLPEEPPPSAQRPIDAQPDIQEEWVNDDPDEEDDDDE